MGELKGVIVEEPPGNGDFARIAEVRLVTTAIDQ
jgi:hypothetical protein